MAKIGELDFFGVKLFNRDFGGEKFGPESRQFSVEIDDPELAQKLTNDGVKLWYSNYVVDNEPPKAYMNVKVDFRYGDCDIIMITSEGNTTTLNAATVSTLDKAWIKNADLHVLLNAYERPNRKGVTVYCKTLVVELMSKEEREQIMAERGPRSNPVMDKYKNYFNN